MSNGRILWRNNVCSWSEWGKLGNRSEFLWLKQSNTAHPRNKFEAWVKGAGGRKWSSMDIKFQCPTIRKKNSSHPCMTKILHTVGKGGGKMNDVAVLWVQLLKDSGQSNDVAYAQIWTRSFSQSICVASSGNNQNFISLTHTFKSLLYFRNAIWELLLLVIILSLQLPCLCFIFQKFWITLWVPENSLAPKLSLSLCISVWTIPV